MNLPQHSIQATLKASRESALADYAENLLKNPGDHIAAHIHLSRLQKQYRREHYMRIAIETFESLVKPLDGQIFALSDGDIIFVTRSGQSIDASSAINRLRVLFQEDPLTQYTSDTDHGDFCTWYRLSSDAKTFHNIVRSIKDAYERRLNLLEKELNINVATNKPRLEPLSPVHLSKLQEMLMQADLSNLIRTQTICTIAGERNGPARKPVFREIFVSIADLQALLMPNVDFLAEPLLFRYLTATLDRRVIAWSCRENIGMSQPFSLNMNIATILSPEFSRLDHMVSGHLRGRIVVELQLADIFADIGAYLFARDWLQEHGYRIAIDGLTHRTLPFVDRARLGCDLIKIYWTGGIEEMPPTLLPELKAQVQVAGQARTILCRCDSEQAIAYGQEAGIIMYQGRLIERLMRENATF